MQQRRHGTESARPLYTAEERARRDATYWTLVQGILAPVQFLVFLISVVLVLNGMSGMQTRQLCLHKAQPCNLQYAFKEH